MSELIKKKGKIEIMDEYIAAGSGKTASSEICGIVYEVFEIDIDRLPILYKESTDPRTAIDVYIVKHGIQSGTEIRAMLNEIFGMNLGGIAAIGQARISLFSKGQWMTRHADDLFLVHTGTNDIDVKILPTPYFIVQTGLAELPEKMQRSLSALNYRYNEKMKAYYYSNPLGEPVPDAFKRSTMSAIIETVKSDYSSI